MGGKNGGKRDVLVIPKRTFAVLYAIFMEHKKESFGGGVVSRKEYIIRVYGTALRTTSWAERICPALRRSSRGRKAEEKGPLTEKRK